ncbi:MAG: GspH/FimT family pseudopilin [Deltaproteobacteria bacterium]|nr:GspH/FimT family pseudopilin [Deltaproteobacteria bacterium]
MRNPIFQKGFTLVELIVTIAVLCIVLSIATVSFKDMLWRNQVNAAANDFVSALNFARSEAVTRGQVVTVCRSTNIISTDNPATPVPSCSTAAGTGWETGYIVFVDGDADGLREVDDELLRVVAGPGGNVTIVGNATVDDNISYAATGFLQAGVGNGTVGVANGSKTINVVLSNNGRVRTE